MGIPKWGKVAGGIVVAVFVLAAAAASLLSSLDGGALSAGAATGGVAVTGYASDAGPNQAPALGMSSAAGKASNASAEAVPSPAPSPGSSSATQHGEKILKAGTLVLEASDPTAVATRLKAVADKYGAFVEDESFTAGDAPTGYAVYRVPAAKYDAFVAEAKSPGTVLSLSIQASDATKAYDDTKVQLASTLEELAAVEKLLSRARSVTEILAIREQTRELRSEADQLASSLASIDDQAAYSTLTVQVQSPAAVKGESFWGNNTLQALLTVFQGSLRSVGLFLAALVPWALAVGLVWAIVALISLLRHRKSPPAA